MLANPQSGILDPVVAASRGGLWSAPDEPMIAVHDRNAGSGWYGTFSGMNVLPVIVSLG
ncbi:MAG: hypothetical protein ACU0B5_01950 [Roseovarius sp.]